MSRPYFLPNIRALLTEGFSDEELRRLCYDVPDFRPVYDQLARDTGKAGIIDRLLEHSEQKVLIETLLNLAKKLNPARYEQHQPYYGHVAPPSRSDIPGKSQVTLDSTSIPPDTSLADFVIVTAIEEERNVLLSKLPDCRRLKPSDEDIRVYFSSNLPVTFSDGSSGTYRIVVMPLLGMGRVQATTATSDAIHRWQPRYVILVGIAGGVAAKGVNLGDVLVSDQIVDYELQKLTAEGTQIRWQVHPADPRLLGAARNFSDENWWGLIKVKRPGRGVPKRYIGPIASGDKVIAFGEILAHYRGSWPELIGVEMEAAGVATASFQAAKPPGFLMVRAVSDFADETKGSNRVEKWRSYACDTAASYLIALLKSGPVPLTMSGTIREQPPGPTPGQLSQESQEPASTVRTPPKREPQIANPKRLSLPPDTEIILKAMFAGYWRIVIEKEFGGGFSGGRVFMLRPIRSEDRPELPAVVKIASISLIEKEWQTYQAHIRDRLPNAIGMRDQPVLLPDSEWGGLRYPLVGSGAFVIQSLRDYCREAALEDIRFVLEERLLKAIESLLQFNRVSPAFSLQASYDPLLPLNLLVQPGAVPAGTKPVLLTPEALPTAPLKQGDYVRLAGFVVTKVDLVDGTVSLNVPTPPGDPPASYSLRLKSVRELASYRLGQMIEPLEGQVLETRQERLEAEAGRVLGPGFNLADERLILPDGSQLPNPLLKLPDLLSQFPDVRVGTIHGDLNLENILVDPAIREINLIDFAAAREDHVLHDFLRLETEIVTKLIPELLAQANLGAGVIRPFYEQLHRFMVDPAQTASPQLPHPTLVKPFTMLAAIRKAARQYFFKGDDWTEYYQGLALYLLGALKFANLDRMVEAPAPLPKQVAFWGAATTGKLLVEPFPTINSKQRGRQPNKDVSDSEPPTDQVVIIKPPLVESSQTLQIEKIFDIAVIRELLATALDDSDLIDLCQNYFLKVYNEFSEGMRNSTRRRLLLDYCERHNQLQQLVRHIGRLNPEKYQEYFPYLVKPVIDKFESKKDTDHIQAAKTLGQLGEPDAIPILEAQLLGQQNPNIRYWHAIAIGEIGGNEAKEALNRIQQQLISEGTDPYTLLGIEDAKKMAKNQ